MPDLTQCIEREREARQELNRSRALGEAMQARLALQAARAATDEAVRAVEALLAVLTPDRVEALQRAHDASQQWCVPESCQALVAIKAIRDFVTTPAPTAQGESTGGGDEE